MTRYQEHALIKEVLGNKYIYLSLKSYCASESVDSGTTSVVLVISQCKKDTTISGKGDGIVDATFSALRKELIPNCKSLADVKISSFKVKALTGTKKGISGTDSKVSIDLSVVNGYGKQVFFKEEGRSLIGVSIAVVVSCVEKFLNAELAFFVMKKALEDAYKRNRQDLIERYKIILSSVVKYTPYSI